MNIDSYDIEVTALNKEMLSARATMSNSYIAISSKLVKKAKELDDNDLLGYAYYYLADAYYLMSTDYRKFNINLMNAIEYLQIGGDAELLARCYNLLGIDALNHGNTELALDFFYTGLGYCDEFEGSGVPGFLEFNMAHVYVKLGDIRNAILFIRSAYRHIRKDRGESLYYRNILYCHCFEALCNIRLGKVEAVQKCLVSIDKLAQTKDCNPDFFNGYAVIDTRMRCYHFLDENLKFNEYSGILLGMIRENRYSIDNMEDVFDTARFFLSIGLDDRAREIMELTGGKLDTLNISYLKLDHARLSCEIFRSDVESDQEKRISALEDFYKYSLECEKEKLINYQFFANLRQKLAETEKENVALVRRAETDPLTGLGNRYGLNKYAEYAFDIAFENKTSLAVEILDVDDFKHYNDTYGHQSGDACLKKLGEVIGDMCRKNKAIHAYRYGGDEFVLIYENMTDDDIMNCALEIRNAVTSMKISSSRKSEKMQISISQGIRNSVPLESNKLWDYMYAADNALYEIKETRKGGISIIHKSVIAHDPFGTASK